MSKFYLKTNILTNYRLLNAICILTFITVLPISVILGQTDTIYIDESGKIVEKNKLFIKRLVQFEQEKNLYRVTEYYFNGMLHLNGYSTTSDGGALTGEVVCYDILSKLKNISQYKTATEYYTVYYNITGDTIALMQFDNCKPIDGKRPSRHIFEGFLEIYKDGKRQGFVSYYDNGNIASQYLVDTLRFKNPSKNQSNPDYYLLAEQYDYDGKLLSKFKSGPSGTALDGNVYVYSENEKDFTKSFMRSKRKLSEIKVIANKTPTMIYYLDDYGSINDSLIMSNNMPYNGTYKKNNVISLYKNGQEIGPRKVLNQNGKVIVQIEFSDKEQFIESKLFNSKGKVESTLSFKNNKPWEGTGFYYNQIVGYHDGKKHGLEILFNDSYLSDTLSIIQYDMQIKSGIEKYFINKKNRKVLIGYNKDGLPNNGSFYEKIRYIKTYKDATVVKEEKYISVEDSIHYYFVLDYLADTCMSRLLDTNRILHCNYKDRKPYSGELFLNNNYYPYKNGKLHGVTTLYHFGTPLHSYTYVDGKKEGTYTTHTGNGMVQSTGIFRNDLPYEGMLPNNSRIIMHKDGVPVSEIRDGVAYGSIKWDGFAKYRYLNKIKEGESLFFFDTKKTDTIFFRGIYQNDKPYEGTFLQCNDIGLLTKVSFRNGKKHGQEIIYSKSSTSPVTLEYTYKEGLLHGKSIIKTAETALEGEYAEGKIIRGHHTSYFGDGYFNTLFFTNPNSPHEGYVYNDESRYLFDENNRIAEGYILLNNEVASYKDSKLISITYLDPSNRPQGKYDTLYTRTFSTDGFISKTHQGKTFEKGTYLGDNTTEVVYYSDGQVEQYRLIFKEESIIKGNIIVDGTKNPSLKVTSYSIEATDSELIISAILPDEDLKIKMDFLQNFKFENYNLLMPWKELLNEANSTSYIDMKNGKIIGSYSDKNFEKSGIYIVQENHFFKVIKYKKNKISDQQLSTKGNLTKTIRSI